MSATTTVQLIKDVAFVLYPVTDVKASRRFYEDVLGLSVGANWQNQWVEYDVGYGTLALTTADEKHRAGLRGAVIGLEVTDLDDVLEQLKAHDVPVVDGPHDSPTCHGCSILDPDQNEIILHQRK